MGDYLDDYLARQAQILLLTSMRAEASRAGVTHDAFDEVYGAFLRQSIIEQIAAGDLPDENYMQTYATCVWLVRAAVQHDLKSCRRLSWSEARQLTKLPAYEQANEVRHRQKARLATGAVVPLVWAESVDVFMKANVDMVLTGVVQAAFTKMPGEKRAWRP
jgi:hypothetical protein